MKNALSLLLITVIVIAGSIDVLAQDFKAHELMTFFIISEGPGDGAALGGLEGADNYCATLAEAVGSEGKEWHAYLSAVADGDNPAVNARDRIGNGPWHNSKGALIASSVDELHSTKTNLGKQASLSEKGEPINGRGDSPNRHDILTGSNLDGTLFTGDGDTTCSNWTSNSEDGSAQVGHHDRQGGGQNPTSWNSAHGSRGCSQANLQGTGGNGLYYCFGTSTAKSDG